MKIGLPLARKAILLALACVLLLPVCAAARTVKQKKQAARAQFDVAERLRDALDAKPESQRTRHDFQNVIDAYRKVYYTAPTSVKADASVLAVAELLEEQGLLLNDSKSFKDSIGQYVFLRREYPGSKYRAEALYTMGEIYRDDLNDNVQAKATFEDFLKRYPGNSHAEDARKAVAEINNPSAAHDPFKPKVAKRQHTARPRVLRATEDAPRPPIDDENATTAQLQQAQAQQQDVSATTNADATPHHLARLTGIRHWSTPDYTRVAIDLEQEVKYQAGRVPHPDRIFFDLYGTKLSPELVGKSFEVEAGFLHKIRVAQYKANMARVVLDVDDVAEYSAFLLPNPYRLIIDIHGKLPPNQVASKKETTKPASSDTKPAQPEAKAAQPPTSPTDNAADSRDDVTVTNIKPAEPELTAKGGGIGTTKPSAPKGRGKDRDQDKERVITESPAEVAKTTPPRVVDDTVIDDSNTTGKPTSGPTFEAIAPKESSRNKKKAVDPSRRASVSTSVATTTHTAAPTATGERSLIRALGLKIGKIVVDAGHGGHDTGTIGPNGLQEKDLVLDVALKLGKLLENKLGAEVVYTRDDDTFIPLETRTAIANKEQADLFISIHANSSSDSSARGVETYYLNFTTRADALEVAARENAVSEQSIHELQDLVKKIALKEKIGESREFAADVQHSLYAGLSARSPSLRNRGVKKAPFVVLIGANMPSILAEIAFVSNPEDAKKLKTNEYRQRIAESLYKGVAKYVNSLSGVKVASQNNGYKADDDRASSVAAK
ncbi:MAG TPA: N-acetylmuramoyl-L-alanine amidase [Candidatus Angelobacter sp.]|nr:N-acetylmuramoyl-L-alanine amidase [Candidatus Angelobacter sp.]